VPRRYRGLDIMWWLDRTGIFTQTAQQVHDVSVSREQPSFQLIGRPDHASIDLVRLLRRGARVVGRIAALDGDRMTFADDLVATTAAADVKLATLLRRIDEYATSAGLNRVIDAPEPFEPLWRWFTDAPASLDLRAAGIGSVVWATGFRRAYPWLRVPGVLDARGEMHHHGGVTGHAGLYVLGLHFRRRRNSSFIDGVGEDAGALAAHIAARDRGLAVA
jgi:putative flavoprotein involved in K+ transport